MKKKMSLKTVIKGNVTFGNDAQGKIMGKQIVSIVNGRCKAKNILFVEIEKHNLLSVSQMCDQAYDVLFRYKNFQIKFARIGEVMVEAN